MKKSLIGLSIFLLFALLFFGFPLLPGLFSTQTTKIETDQKVAPFFLKSEHSKAVLVYFGYVGCTTICIPTLNEFSPVYENLSKQFPSLSFYFVNLNPTQPKEWAGPFAKSFHPQFHGIYADINQVNLLEREFNLALSPSDTQMAHTSNLFLLIREAKGYTLKRIYVTHPYPALEIKRDLKRFES